MVAKLKDLGVTTVVMFTDVEMGKAMTAQATRLEYQPEWIIAGYQYQDLALLARRTTRINGRTRSASRTCSPT